MFAPGRGERVAFQGGTRDRLKGAKVGALQPDLLIEVADRGQDLAVRLFCCPDHELGGLADRGAPALALDDEALGPMHGLEEMGAEILEGSDTGQAFRVWCLQVH